ncbi:response regulator transcription factor [Candidatus Omnitrophota bacterium]
MDKKKILVIDDEASFCDVIKEALGENFDTSSAASGKEGLKSAARLKPDVILLDVMMPGMDGFQVLEGLKKDKDTMVIPVIMLSALDDEDTKIRCSELFHEKYVTKPVKIPELKAAIIEVLERRGK